MNSPAKLREVRNLISKNKAIVCVLVETEAKFFNLVVVRKQILRVWDWEESSKEERVCRVWVGWNRTKASFLKLAKLDIGYLGN